MDLIKKRRKQKNNNEHTIAVNNLVIIPAFIQKVKNNNLFKTNGSENREYK